MKTRSMLGAPPSLRGVRAAVRSHVPPIGYHAGLGRRHGAADGWRISVLPRITASPPQWQPTTGRPRVEQVEDRPWRQTHHVLDDYTVGRVITVFTEQRDDLWLFEEQLRRWDSQELTEAQRREIGRVSGRLERLRQVIAAILDLADELKGGTIERVLAKDDAEVGLEFLWRRLSGQDPLE